ncbi:ribonuclease H-like domain-containing protein, partial [Mycena latifolia]
MLLPDNVLVNVCSAEIEIASACNAILAHIVNDSVECHVGFDMEWEYSGSEFSRTSKKTSLIQMAFQTSVFLMRTHLLKTLPSSLLTVITSLQIVKVGRNIGGDLAKLARDFPEYKLPAKVNGQLPGVIELGAFAKAKNAIQKGTASLSAITAAVLHVNLSKEARDSPWDAPSLSSTQINYAALDAWVCLDIWQTLK